LIGALAAPKCFSSAAEFPLQLLVNIILVVNVFVCVALIAVVLLQRSEGGALGMGGGNPTSFMTARGAGDLLTRTTWILAFTFFILSIALTVLTGKLHGGVGSLVDHINVNSLDLSAPQQKAPAPAAPSSAPPSIPALQAPTPQSQSPAQAPPAQGAPDLSILTAPPVAQKAAPQPQAPASTQTPAQAPEKK
jgi:preprotein translocase subunit SecG